MPRMYPDNRMPVKKPKALKSTIRGPHIAVRPPDWLDESEADMDQEGIMAHNYSMVLWVGDIVSCARMI